MRAIHEIDAEELRAKLDAEPEIVEALQGPMREALAEYDRLAAAGERPMLYIDRGVLIVGTKHSSKGGD